MRGRFAIALGLAATLAGSACAGERRASVRLVIDGNAPAPISALLVRVTRVEGPLLSMDTRFDPPEGATEIVLPTSLALVLRTDRAGAAEGALSGYFTVCVDALDPSGASSTTACNYAWVYPGDVTDLVIVLGGSPDPTDGGTGWDRDGADGGTPCIGAPGCGPPAVCGDGDREGAEECDDEDFDGRDCTHFESFTGGVLDCAGDCTVDTSGCF